MLNPYYGLVSPFAGAKMVGCIKVIFKRLIS